MKNNIRLHVETTILGGLFYGLIEILWRGRTHWSMILLGGLCFELVGVIHTKLENLPLLVRGLLCTAGITAMEFFCGCVVNLRLKWNVWDYSSLRYNCKGQVCLLYSFFWLLLALAACPVYRGCRRMLTLCHSRLGQLSRRGHRSH